MRVPPRDASGFLQTPLSKAPRHYAEALRFAFSRRGTSDKVLACHVQVDWICKHRRLIGSNLPHADFGLGAWQGFISPFEFVNPLFKSGLNICKVHNNGAWYNFG